VLSGAARLCSAKHARSPRASRDGLDAHKRYIRARARGARASTRRTGRPSKQRWSAFRRPTDQGCLWLRAAAAEPAVSDRLAGRCQAGPRRCNAVASFLGERLLLLVLLLLLLLVVLLVVVPGE
jgi:hypothetical protein